MPKIRHSRGLPIEQIAHSDLTDMPDLLGTNQDHDVRYATRAELASTIVPSGASLIGISDAGGLFVSTNVEDALQEIVGVILPGAYLRLDGTNVPTANYNWVTNLTTAGTLQGGTLTDGAIIITGGNLTGATNITAAGTIQGGTLTDGTISFTGGVGTGLVSLTDGTASWAGSNLSGFGTIQANTSVTASTLTIAGGSITDTTGAISFGNENLTTTGRGTFANITVEGDIGAGPTPVTDIYTDGIVYVDAINTGVVDALTLTFAGGTMVLASGSITDSTGTISFGNEHLTTTGDGTFDELNLTAPTDNYKIAGDVDNLAVSFQNQTSGQDAGYSFYSKDGDATDRVYLYLYRVGTPTNHVGMQRLVIACAQANTFINVPPGGLVLLSAGGTDFATGNVSISGGDLIFVNAGSGHLYGELWAHGVSTALNSALINDWDQILAFTTGGNSNGTTPSAAQDHITVLTEGVYRISYHWCGHGPAAVHDWDFNIAINNRGTTFNNITSHVTTPTTQKHTSVSAVGYANIAANDTVELWVQRISAGNNIALTTVSCNITVEQVGGT